MTKITRIEYLDDNGKITLTGHTLETRPAGLTIEQLPYRICRKLITEEPLVCDHCYTILEIGYQFVAGFCLCDDCAVLYRARLGVE